MSDPYQTSIRNFGRNVPHAESFREACHVVTKDGTVFVTRDQCDRWKEDGTLRDRVRRAGVANGHRLFSACTASGYMVDVWQVDHWQSGLD
jgi:hypothetical protein